MITIYDYVKNNINSIISAVAMDNSMEGPHISPLMAAAHCTSHNDRAKALKLIRDRLKRIGLDHLMGSE